MKRLQIDNEEFEPALDAAKYEDGASEKKRSSKSLKPHSSFKINKRSISSDKAPVARLLRRAADIRKSEENSHETLWRYLANVYELAFVAQQDDTVFRAICDDPAWKKLGDEPDESDRENLISLLIKSTLGGERRTVQQKASDYKIGLASLWRRKTKPKYVRDYIRSNGGIEAMKNAERKRRDERFEGTISVSRDLDEKGRVKTGDMIKMYADVLEADDGQLILRPISVNRAKPSKKWTTF